MNRRKLDLRSADEVIREIELIKKRGYVRTGDWNLTQICEHLTATMRGGMHGFDFTLPGFLRSTVGTWAFKRALKKRKLPSGLPTFKSLQPEYASIDDNPGVVDACIATCKSVEEFKGPLKEYPLAKNVHLHQWKELMWIHAAHHLSFLVPKEASTDDVADLLKESNTRS